MEMVDGVVVGWEMGDSVVVGWEMIQQMWRRGVVVIATAELHSTKRELRFRAGSNPARGVSEIRDDEYV